MVKYRDGVFPYYMKLNREIVDDEIVKKIRDFHFDSFDNIYQALKREDSNYNEIVNENIEHTNAYIKKLIKS